MRLHFFFTFDSNIFLPGRCTDESNQPSGPDNYALEWYGRGSRCFEQASKWEQRTCSTLKQWKRFGAGCYGHRCSDGMVHVVVRNVSMACAQEGQVIDVRLMQDSWLHEGEVGGAGGGLGKEGS